MAGYAGVTAQRWTARSAVATACRVTALAGPVVAAAVLTLVAGRWLPSAAGGGAAVARWMAIAAVALFAAAFAQRLLGRLLPIAALFDPAIGFRSDAPTRLRVASLARPRRHDTILGALHNVRFYQRLMADARSAILEQRFAAWKREQSDRDAGARAHQIAVSAAQSGFGSSRRRRLAPQAGSTSIR